MRTITSFLFLLLLVSLDTYAQKHLFRMFRFESSQLYDIDLTKPKGFKVIKGMTMFKVNKKNSIGTAYQLALESKAKDCLILSSLCMFKSHELMAKNMFYGELESALNIFVNPDIRPKLVNGKFMIQGTSNQLSANNTHKLDSAKYITIIARENMKDCFNADTVFIWKAPVSDWWSPNLPKSYNDNYDECVGVYVIKKGHPSALIKMLFTAEGKKKEEEYMRALFKSIHYSDIAPEVNSKVHGKVRKKMKLKFFFYNRKKYCYFSNNH